MIVNLLTGVVGAAFVAVYVTALVALEVVRQLTPDVDRGRFKFVNFAAVPMLVLFVVIVVTRFIRLS